MLNYMLKFALSAFISLFLIGCASVSNVSYLDRAQDAISKGNWEIGYRFLEDSFISSNNEIREKGKSIYRIHPELAISGLYTFSVKRLQDSVVSYGLKTSHEIEGKRLEMFKVVASPSDYIQSKSNYDNYYGDLIRKEAEMQEAEQQKKLADLLKRQEADQREKADRLERIRRLKIDLADAESNASVRCREKLECDKVFSLTQIFINDESDMKIQLATDSIVETYNSVDTGKIGMKAIRIPGVGTSAAIILTINCKGDNELCWVKMTQKYRGFNSFISKMLK